MEVEVVSVEDDGYYSDEHISGSCVKVTLRRGNEYVSCEQILFFEEDDDLNSVFDEWAEVADGGEEGYKHWTE